MLRYFNFDVYNTSKAPVDCSATIETNTPFITANKAYQLCVVRAQVPLSRIPVCTPSYLKGCSVGIHDKSVGKPVFIDLEARQDLTQSSLVDLINQKFTQLYEEVLERIDPSYPEGTFHVQCKINHEGSLSFTPGEATAVQPGFPAEEKPVDECYFYISEDLFPLFGTLPYTKLGDIYRIDVKRDVVYPSSLTTFMEFDRLSIITDLPLIDETCVSASSTYGQKILTDYSLLQVSDFSSYALIIPQVERWISMLNSTEITRANLRIHLRSKTGNDKILTIAPKYNLGVKLCIKEI